MSDRTPHGDESERAARRNVWPVRRFAFGAETPDDLIARTTPEERMAMVWPFTVEAWSAAGLRLPEGRIQDLPSRIWRDGRSG